MLKGETTILTWTEFRTFRRDHPIFFRIVLSLFIGLLLEISITFLPIPQLKFVRQSADETTDLMTRLAVTTGAASSTGPRFSFIDIDQKSWLAWGAPLVTPRDKIAILLARIGDSKPAMIILDVNLAFRDDTKFERELQDFLEAYPGTAPPLVLVRTLEPSSDSSYPEIRKTEFESIPAQSTNTQSAPSQSTPIKKNILWALPSFERGDDGVVRRWQLAVVACNAGALDVIPSLQLQAFWLWLKGSPEDMATSLAALRPGNCNEPAPKSGINIEFDGKGVPVIKTSGGDTSTRIIYSIPWRPDSVGLGPQMPDGSSKVILRSADDVLGVPPGEGLQNIEGSIAVVGGSFADSEDWYQTPLGKMPGALVLINAIDALVQHGTPMDLTLAKRLAVSFGFIVFVSTCVGWFRSVVAAFLSLIGFGIFMLATLPMFKSGVVASLAIPSIGILVVDFMFSALRIFKGFREKGWHWILKSSQTGEPDAEEKT